MRSIVLVLIMATAAIAAEIGVEAEAEARTGSEPGAEAPAAPLGHIGGLVGFPSKAMTLSGIDKHFAFQVRKRLSTLVSAKARNAADLVPPSVDAPPCGQLFGRPRFASEAERERILALAAALEQPRLLCQLDVAEWTDGLSGRQIYVLVEAADSEEWSEIRHVIAFSQAAYAETRLEAADMAELHPGQAVAAAGFSDLGHLADDHPELYDQFPADRHLEVEALFDELLAASRRELPEAAEHLGHLGGYPVFNGGPLLMTELHEAEARDCELAEYCHGYDHIAQVACSPDLEGHISVLRCRGCGLIGLDLLFT